MQYFKNAKYKFTCLSEQAYTNSCFSIVDTITINRLIVASY